MRFIMAIILLLACAPHLWAAENVTDTSDPSALNERLLDMLDKLGDNIPSPGKLQKTAEKKENQSSKKIERAVIRRPRIIRTGAPAPQTAGHPDYLHVYP